jgi:hypothetical protein
MRSQLSSRTLALVAAAANLVVCTTIVTLQYALRPPDPLAEAVTALESFPESFPETVTETVSEPTSPPVTTTTQPPADYQLVAGPGGMTTHIPAYWPTKVAPGPGAMQADDPAGTTQLLRYGGAPTPVTDSYQIHADYEVQFSRNKDGYVSLRLERTYVRGMSAIDWEFEYDALEGRRHVRSVYWLAQGHEYFVYASAPAALWPQTQEILDIMLDHSTP